MSENENAQAIRKRTRAIIDAGWYLQQRPRWESVVTVAQEITEHTDALAAQLAEAEARVAEVEEANDCLWRDRSRIQAEIYSLLGMFTTLGDLPDAARGEAE